MRNAYYCTPTPGRRQRLRERAHAFKGASQGSHACQVFRAGDAACYKGLKSLTRDQRALKVSSEERAPREAVLTVELDSTDVEPYIDRAYKQVVRRANIPGFRKGKAPRRIISWNRASQAA